MPSPPSSPLPSGSAPPSPAPNRSNPVARALFALSSGRLPRRRRSNRLALALSLLYLLLLLNTWWALLRFESPLANHIFGQVLMILPIPIAVIAIVYLRNWLSVIIATPCLVVAIPFLAVAMLFTSSDLQQILKYGKDISMDPCSETWQGSIRVRAFETAWGFGGGNGIWVRQEIRLFPGLLLVRDLYENDDSLGGTVAFRAPGIIHIAPDSNSDIQPFDLKLRSFIPICTLHVPPSQRTRSYTASFFAPLADSNQ